MWPELLNTMAAISKGLLFFSIAGGLGLLIAFEIALIVLKSIMP